MKLTRCISAMKRLLPGTLLLLVIGLLAACGGPDYTKTSIQNTQASVQDTQNALLSAPGALSKDVTYPDPTNQAALPASVKVTSKGETVLLRTSVVEGYQIYECQASSTAASGFAWKLQAPFAFLKADNGTNIIHSTGPTWLYTLDGSEVRAAVGKFTDAKGNVVPASATPDAKSVAWLRLDVTDHRGNKGLFSNVDQIQRIYTHNGIAPGSGCDRTAASQHVIRPVSYTAEYVFWGHKG